MASVWFCDGCHKNFTGFVVCPKRCPVCQQDWKDHPPGRWPFLISVADVAFLRCNKISAT